MSWPLWKSIYNSSSCEVVAEQNTTTMKQSILLLIASLLTTHAFQTGIISSSRSRATAATSSGPLFSAVAEEETAVKNELLKRDRYVATNRFTVRQGRAAKFEKRWGKSLIVLCAASMLFFSLVCVESSLMFLLFSRHGYFFHLQPIAPPG